MSPHAYFNSSKLCWEILIEEPQGDRMVLVLKEANTAHKMLKERGIKFVDAKTTKFSRPLLLITDPEYWLTNEKEIVQWLIDSNIHWTLNGMVLDFDTPEEKMMFMLRWS
jgi:hypothetical protein